MSGTRLQRVHPTGARLGGTPTWCYLELVALVDLAVPELDVLEVPSTRRLHILKGTNFHHEWHLHLLSFSDSAVAEETGGPTGRRQRLWFERQV